MLKQIIKGMFILSYLIICNSYADGIISNLDEYLKKYPDRIDEQGWVTIPRDDLENNSLPFRRNCQYQLMYNDNFIASPLLLSESTFHFKCSCKNRLFEVDCQDKLIIWSYEDGLHRNREISKCRNVTAIKQLSPESSEYASKKRLESILKISPSKFINFMFEMQEEVKKLREVINNLTPKHSDEENQSMN